MMMLLGEGKEKLLRQKRKEELCNTVIPCVTLSLHGHVTNSIRDYFEEMMTMNDRSGRRYE